ncbi:hypothetical protein N0V95_002046 [Ascochyta clinopodiicola]|nr:hypothetical protein N0V95_002046 [Ascochyta clinopodiicola]
MKSFITLLSAAALLASCVSAAPTVVKPTQDYNIEDPIEAWSQRPNVKKTFERACATSGGWEGWAQVELEDAFIDEFGLDPATSVREISDVFRDKKRADFVLPETTLFRGMIIELKCENKGEQKGAAVAPAVGKDEDKKYSVKAAYQEYTFVTLAIAYSTEAEAALVKIGMKAIPRSSVKLRNGQGTMKVFMEKVKASLTIDTEAMDLSDTFDKLSISPKSKTNPKAPAARPSNPKQAAPAPKKPAASAPKKGSGSGPGSGSASGNGKKPVGS